MQEDSVGIMEGKKTRGKKWLQILDVNCEWKKSSGKGLGQYHDQK